MDTSGNRTASLLLLLLMAVNFVLVFLGALKVYTTGGPTDDIAFNIGTERGFAGIVVYVEELAIVAFLLLLLIASRALYYLPWLLLFCYILMDDFFRLHESMGHGMADRYGLEAAFGLRRNDFGELACVMVFSLLLGGIILHSYRRLRDDEGRTFYRRLSVLVLALGFFGVFVDMFDIIFDYRIFHLVEDGGEMVVISIILWFLVKWSRSVQGVPAAPRLRVPA